MAVTITGGDERRTEVTQLDRDLTPDAPSKPLTTEQRFRQENQIRLLSNFVTNVQPHAREAFALLEESIQLIDGIQKGIISTTEQGVQDRLQTLADSLNVSRKAIDAGNRTLLNDLNMHYGDFEKVPTSIRANIHDAPKVLGYAMDALLDLKVQAPLPSSDPRPAEIAQLHKEVGRLGSSMIPEAIENDVVQSVAVSLHAIRMTAFSQAVSISKDGFYRATNIPKNLETLEVPGSGLLQVVANELVTNAADAIASAPHIKVFDPVGRPSKPQIVLNMGIPADRPDMLEMIVRNQGPAIPPQVMERMFDAGFSTKRGGTGQGLSIIKGAIQELGGTLDVTSEAGTDGVGLTVFTVRVPLKANT